MNTADVDKFEKVVGQLQSVYDELSVLSKKSPNDALSKFKVRFVNSLLRQSEEILGESYRPFEDFSEFEDEDIPQNSDVVFMLGQYLQCFEKLRADNVAPGYGGRWYWHVEPVGDEKPGEDGLVEIQTVVPRRLRETK